MTITDSVARLEHPAVALPPALPDLYRRSNLTMGQLMFWVGQSRRPSQPLYNMGSACSLTGPLEPEHLRRAFEALVRGSDALRTVIDEQDGVPRQRVADAPETPLEMLDLSGPGGGRARLRDWVEARERELFSLPERLSYAALLRLSAEEHVLYFKHHHAIIDGTSAGVLLDHVSRFYDWSRAGRLSASVPLPSFHQHVARERRRRLSPEHPHVAAYWARKLASSTAPLHFFGEHRPQASGRVRRVSLDLGLPRTQRLRALAAEADVFRKTPAVSMFNVQAAILLILLWQLTDEPRLSLGVPFHGRTTAEERAMLGLLMEELVLTVEVRARDTLVSLSERLSHEAGESMRHRPVFVDELTLDKAYEVLFNYLPLSTPRLQGVHATHEWLHSGYGDEKLALHVHDRGDGASFVASFDFSCDVFDGDRQRAIMRQFVRLVDVALEDRRRPLAELPRPPR